MVGISSFIETEHFIDISQGDSEIELKIALIEDVEGVHYILNKDNENKSLRS